MALLYPSFNGDFHFPTSDMNHVADTKTETYDPLENLYNYFNFDDFLYPDVLQRQNQVVGRQLASTTVILVIFTTFLTESGTLTTTSTTTTTSTETTIASPTIIETLVTSRTTTTISTTPTETSLTTVTRTSTVVSTSSTTTTTTNELDFSYPLVAGVIGITLFLGAFLLAPIIASFNLFGINFGAILGAFNRRISNRRRVSVPKFDDGRQFTLSNAWSRLEQLIGN